MPEKIPSWAQEKTWGKTSRMQWANLSALLPDVLRP